MEVLYGPPRGDGTRRGRRREVQESRGFGIPSQVRRERVIESSREGEDAVNLVTKAPQERNQRDDSTPQESRWKGTDGAETDSNQATFPSTSIVRRRGRGKGGGGVGVGVGGGG